MAGFWFRSVSCTSLNQSEKTKWKRRSDRLRFARLDMQTTAAASAEATYLEMSVTS
jgi:hypothetical protein